MKSLEKLLRPCGQNHLRWSCLSISFNFLSELGFNWTIDHNEDFNRQSRIELGGRLIRIAALTSDWSGMWAARTIDTSTSPSGSWVINSLNISIEIKPTDRFVFCNIFTRLLPSVDCVSWIFLPGAWSRRGGGGADSPVSGCDNYPDPGPGVCLHPGSCYTVVTWHRVTLSRCHDHCDAVFITWSRQELVMWGSCYREWPPHPETVPGDQSWPHTMLERRQKSEIGSNFMIKHPSIIAAPHLSWCQMWAWTRAPARSFLSPGRLCKTETLWLCDGWN